MKKTILSVAVTFALFGASSVMAAGTAGKSDDNYGGVPLSEIGSSLTQSQMDKLKAQQEWLKGQLEIETLKAKINKVKSDEKSGKAPADKSDDKNTNANQSPMSNTIRVQNMSNGQPIIGPNGQVIYPNGNQKKGPYILGGVIGESNHLVAQLTTPDGDQINVRQGDNIAPGVKVVKVSSDVVMLEEMKQDADGKVTKKYVQVFPGNAKKSQTSGPAM